jgi:hypothetical protein
MGSKGATGMDGGRAVRCQVSGRGDGRQNGIP